MKHFKLFFTILLATLIYGSALHAQDAAKENKIKAYVAVVMKTAFEKSAKEFNELYKTEITSDIKGSGHLMGAIKLNPVGDIFIPADASYTDMLKKDKLVTEVFQIAEMYPVIVVQKGNPKGIKSLADFKREDVKVSLVNPEAASIGAVVKKNLVALGDWDAISANATKNGVFKTTVAEVANDVKMKTTDATIIWNCMPKTKSYSGDLDYIEVEALTKNKEYVTIGVIANSKNPELAIKFAKFMTAKDKGQKYIAEEFFTTIANTKTWEEIEKSEKK
jgi:molybdate transport system substrate-binding protein